MTSEQISGLITSAQLNNGFAALSVLTRAIVHDELMKALRDTSVEYHRSSDKRTQQKLFNEINGINALIKSIELVSQEFEDINAPAS